MRTLDFLAGARIDRTGRQIRSQLVILRRRKLILAAQNAKPERNPGFDSLLRELHHLRVRLDFQIRKVELEHTLAPAEDAVLVRAREILADAAEMIDLLIWFGAEISEGDTESGNLTG